MKSGCHANTFAGRTVLVFAPLTLLFSGAAQARLVSVNATGPARLAILAPAVALGTVYDFGSGAGVDRFAFGNALPAAPLPPVTNAVPSTVFGSADYAAVALSDDSRYSTGVIEGGNVAATRFVFSIAEPPGAITQIDILWEGGGDQDAFQTVWLWNAGTASYVLAGSRTGAVPPDGTVAQTITTNPSDYVDASGNLTILVNYNAEGGALLTDYVSVTITGPQCAFDADCDDGLACNGAETCVGALLCEPGTPIVCDDGIACTVDSCVDPAGTCDYVPNHAACDNDVFCDGAEVCDAAAGCLPGTDVDCDDGIACTADVCNEFGGYCDNIPDAGGCVTPSTWYVDVDAPGANGGTSWQDAFATLQDALGAATYGDEIWVAGGTYKPDEGAGQTPGDMEATFFLHNGVALYGHFVGTETTIAQRDLTDLADPLRQTILSGDIGIPGNAADNALHVAAVSGVDYTTVLDGFTIRDGSAWDVLGYGGGVYIATGSPQISNCIITANNAGAGGGGVYNASGTPTLINCTFTANTADFGGGMANGYGSPVLIDCTFTANGADESGGGMAEMFGDSTLTNCRFFDNFTVVGNGTGGGMYVSPYGGVGNATLTNCLFSGNSSDHGGGMLAWGFATLANCTFSQNYAAYDSGGFGTFGAPSSVTNCILWGNTGGGTTLEQQQLFGTALSVDYSCVQGWTGALGGVGNNGADPLFADPGLGDFHLSTDSPCIDAGNNDAVPQSVTTDLDGNPRVVNAVVDMGAYEFQEGGPEIPAVSQWGIVVMVLLLLTAGTMVAARCGESASPGVAGDWRDAGSIGRRVRTRPSRARSLGR
ncbi:MAG: right-handed parallel beta-helix repeat-containing protein [Phycisphaerae bacterium]